MNDVDLEKIFKNLQDAEDAIARNKAILEDWGVGSDDEDDEDDE